MRTYEAYRTDVVCVVCGTVRRFSLSVAKRRRTCGQECAYKVRGEHTRRRNIARWGDWRDRFWRNVQKGDGCWEWQAHRDRDGYGRFTVPDREKRFPAPASRIAWELANGTRVPDGLIVCHHCDNPPCCRPDHLYVGTFADNVRDSYERGRQNPPRGERQGGSKLTAEQIREIRTLILNGHRHRDIAARFAVDPSLISRIRHGEVWAHVT
jgi:HNH endonuclease